MTYKTIAVQVEPEARGARTLAVAVSLARRFDAHLIGVAVKQPIYVPTYAAAQVPPELFEAFLQEQTKALAVAKSAFGAAVESAGMTNRAEYRLIEGDLLDCMEAAARLADLTVVGQYNPGVDPATDEPLVDALVIHAGRPVLVVPHIGAPEEIGRRVLVAWNNSREAARAVADALPLLAAATKVTVVTADARKGEDVPGADLARFLAEHGVKAEVTHTRGKDLDVGPMLLSMAADGGHDLLVMGAYGRSRVREMVLGGASNHIIRHMTLPVLMSH
jgi:nucleotide-binding universal stress UspA family protein